MTPDDIGASSSSNSSSCAPVLCLAKTLKLAPPGTSVTPNGKLLPLSKPCKAHHRYQRTGSGRTVLHEEIRSGYSAPRLVSAGFLGSFVIASSRFCWPPDHYAQLPNHRPPKKAEAPS